MHNSLRETLSGSHVPLPHRRGRCSVLLLLGHSRLQQRGAWTFGIFSMRPKVTFDISGLPSCSDNRWQRISYIVMLSMKICSYRLSTTVRASIDSLLVCRFVQVLSLSALLQSMNSVYTDQFTLIVSIQTIVR